MTLKSLALCLVVVCMALTAATLGFTVVGATLFAPDVSVAAALTTVQSADDRKSGK